MVKLSVITISYNTKKITIKTINNLINSLSQFKFLWEIIIVDNGSNDGSVDFLVDLKKKNKSIKLIKNKKNLGYSKANNQAIKYSRGQYLLFLNSDVLVKKVNFLKIFSFLDKNEKVGGLTVKVLLENGKIDWASHRGFPTLWNSFCYFFKLENFLGRIPLINYLFGGYHLTFKNLDKIHEIDSASGAFFLVRKKIIDKIGGFDESFFMYGEDLDLSYRIKKEGYKIIYYPKYEVIHLKYMSGLKKNDERIKKETKRHFFNAMKIFYQKYYQKKYPQFLNKLVYFFIDFKSGNLTR